MNPNGTDPAVVADPSTIGSLGYLLKLVAVWSMTLLGNIRAEKVATYLAIVYTSFLLIDHIRTKWLVRRSTDAAIPEGVK